MKKLVLFLTLSMSVMVGTFAQENFEDNPKIKELRKKYFAKEMNFTDTEAKDFWPLFDQMQRDQRNLRKKYNAGANTASFSDKELKAHLDGMFEYDQKKADLKKTYFDKFSKVLPVRKVAMIEPTERKFKREVLKRVRENRQKRNKQK